MPKTAFENYLCRPFCPYYRIGSSEPEICRGAAVLDALLRKGRLSEAALPLPQTPPSQVERHSPLDRQLCSACPFQAADCDFQAQPPVADSLPCGGYRLLAALLRNRRLTLDDLADG